MLKSTISEQFREIMKANEGNELLITMFPRDMWLSQAELNMFMRAQRKQMGLSEVRYYCAINQTCIPYWEGM